jgi:hypothetical protein
VNERFVLAGRYVLETTIASGGMATVWRARDQVLARTVAVKVLHSHLVGDEDFMTRFRREALAAARLSHPHIVAIYDTGRDKTPDGGERPYIVMEHCEGGSLADVVVESGPFDPAHAAAVGATVCEALAFAHDAGIIHRDVKPANVLVSGDGSLKVADFGIAKAAFAGGDLTTTGSILGTVTYLSPEQLHGLEPDARSDIYALGVLLYELITGRPPFQGASQFATALKHQREAPAPIRSLRTGVPRSLEGAVMKALAKDPNDRYASADEMRAALAGVSDPAAMTTLDTVPSRPRPADAAPRPGRRGVVPILGALGALVIVALVVAAIATRDDPLVADGSDEGRDAGGNQRAVSPVDVARVSDFDPYGGDGEHPEEAELAVDGDPATFWRTSTYETSLAALGKPGVGLLLDLGNATAITRVDVRSPSPGFAFELRAGERPAEDESGFEVVERMGSAPAASRLEVDGFRARYWLLWITSLPDPGGGRAEVSEVRFFGA